MDSYSEFMAWVSYAKAELVKAEIAEAWEEHQCNFTEAKILVSEWDAEAKGDRVTIARARREINPEVVAQKQKHLQARAFRKLTESVFDRCERGAQVLSRELSRRIGLNPKERAGHRYSA